MTIQINYQGKRLVGIDEVGRGPLAGPVVAAAVILKEPIPGLADSKKLTEKKRLDLTNKIKDQALCFGIGRVTPAEIDEINILQASLLAMQRAVDELPILPEYGAVDGTHLPQLSFPCQAVIKGDSLIPAISAASILAKVIRDQEMVEMNALYPGYGFAKHKGYPTKNHREALINLGASPIHRLSFAPVKRVLDLNQELV